jgi:16S rRNA (guanine(966)-N(2))-methyltransferase RsmD
LPRIISGSARGTHLAAPPGRQTRPTSDRVKEALFSILTPRLPAHGFLDLYAGTGQVGLEAASRGSTDVVLVEQAREGLQAIRTNLAKTHLDARVRVVAGDVRRVVPDLLSTGCTYDLVFLDPPYQQADAVMAMLAPWLADLLRPDGLVILEHDASQPSPPFVTNLQLVRDCQYGTAMLSFYQRYHGCSDIDGPV